MMMFDAARKPLAACAVVATTTLMAGGLPTIDSKTEFAGVYGATLTRTPEALVFTEIDKDMKIQLKLPPFFAAEASGIEMRYRATGDGKAGGQVFYAVGASPFSDRHKWNLPPLKRDGQWQVMKVGLDRLADREDWLSAGIVDTFRFDPTDSAGGTLEISSVRFVGAADTAASAPENVPQDVAETLDSDVFPVRKPDLWKGFAAQDARPQPTPVAVRSLGGTATPACATAGETVRLSYDFRGPMPMQGPIALRIRLMSGESSRWEETVRVPLERIAAVGDDVWRLSFDYELPLYLNSCDVQVRAESPTIRCLSGHFPDARLSIRRIACAPGWEKPVRAGVMRVADVPQFALNGKPFYALWGTSNPAKSADGLSHHSSAPLNVVTVWPDHLNWWPKGDVFDPAVLDRYAEAHRRSYPDAWFIWDISIYPPPDWAETHPDDMARDEQGRVNRDRSEFELNYSFASERAAADMERMLERVIGYLEGSPYANRIIGYRVNSGHTVEWLAWTPSGKDTILDFSPVAQKGFERFARANYPAVTDFSVPTLAERREMDSDGVLWDQKKHARTVAYHDFYSTCVADLAIRLCSKAKTLVGGSKLVGTYFGYVMTLNSTGRDQMRAHFATKRMLDSGAVDFLMSPQPYSTFLRGIGSSVGDMKPFASLRDRGIVSVIEDDTRTHNAPAIGCSQALDEAMTLAVMRRNMGVTLCRNAPFYSVSISKAGRDFDFPAFADDARILRIAGEHALARKTRRQAEIAVVVSEESIKATPFVKGHPENYRRGFQFYRADGSVVREGSLGGSMASTWPYQNVYDDLACVGAPVDYRLAEDLADNPGDYRLYVFVNCHKRTPALVRAVEKLRARDCTILWTYAPGFVSDEGNSVDSMKALTGMDFIRCEGRFNPELTLADGSKTGAVTPGVEPLFAVARPDEVLGRYANGEVGFAAVKTGRASSVFCGTYCLETPILRRIAKSAGVFLFSDSCDALEANERFVTLHVRRAGSKTIRLPRKTDVIDVFSRRIVAKGTDAFTFEAPLHSSWLFYFADDAGELLKGLR